jgi:hypothetical protein
MIALDRLQQIIPADQALANKALATALTQIGGVNQLNLTQFATVVSAQQTTKNLTLISDLQQPVPASVANYFTSTLAQGTGPNGTVVVMDLLGTAAGWVSADALTQAYKTLNGMDLTNLNTVYTTMLDVVSGVYGDPITGPVIIPSGPYAGTYTDANEAFSTVLISAAESEISLLITTYPDQTTQLNQLWNSICDQLVLERTLQPAASLNFADLSANQRNSIYGFVYSLPGYGQDTEQGGVAQLVEDVADLNTFTGQAIVACMREGQNQTALDAAGIVVSNQIPDQPAEPPPQANLISSTYTESEAANLVIK